MALADLFFAGPAQVVRIEAGMVIVDTKDVDQEVGKDLDPEHEKAEVEDCGTMGEPWGNQDGGTKMGTTPRKLDHWN